MFPSIQPSLRYPHIHIGVGLINAAQTVTFYQLNGKNESVGEEISISALGVNQDGATTYLEEWRVSQYIQWDATTTVTATIPVETLEGANVLYSPQVQPPKLKIATVVMDKSSLLATFIPEATTVAGGSTINITIADNCTFDGEGGEVCVVKQWDAAATSSPQTFTATFSGSAVPVYTLTVNAAPSIRVPGTRGRWYSSGAVLATLLIGFFGLVPLF